MSLFYFLVKLLKYIRTPLSKKPTRCDTLQVGPGPGYAKIIHEGEFHNDKGDRSMELTFQLSEEDVLQAFLLNKRKPFLYALPSYVTLGLFAILMGYYLLLLLLGFVVDLLPLFLLLLFAGFFALNRYYFFPRATRKYYRSSPELQSPTTLKAAEGGMTFISETGTASRTWDQFHGWKENEDYLLLYVSTLSMHILPRRIFEQPANYDFLKDKIEEHSLEKVKYPQRTLMTVGLNVVFSGFLIYALITLFW